MTRRSRPTIPPIIRSCSAKKKSPTSASRPSTSSTRRARLRRGMVISSWPGAADAAVDAVAVVDAVDAADVAADVAAADAALDGGADAACPGALAGSAKRDRLAGLIEASCYGRVRHCRPGHALCPEVIPPVCKVKPALGGDTKPHQKTSVRHWLREFPPPTRFVALTIERGGQASCAES
jgi:hypothetical protein